MGGDRGAEEALRMEGEQGLAGVGGPGGQKGRGRNSRDSQAAGVGVLQHLKEVHAWGQCLRRSHGAEAQIHPEGQGVLIPFLEGPMGAG